MRGKTSNSNTQTGCAENKDGCTHQRRLEVMALTGDKTDRAQVYKSQHT